MPQPDPKRRRFLNLCTNLLMALLTLMLAIPAISYFLAPLRRRVGTGPTFIDVGPLSSFPIGEWRLHTLAMVHEDGWRKTRVRHAIWVRRQGDQEVIVLSSICPHLGCPVNWQPDQTRFYCPCHGGIFDVSGQHAGGPPPRSMDPLEFEFRTGRLWVRWQDFKIGVAQRIPVSA